MTPIQPSRSPSSGFTLIEIAIVLVIIGLLLGGLLMPFGAQEETRRIATTTESIDAGLEALYGYALATGTLPCPDTGNDGLEETSCGATALEGRVPWATLGVAAGDAFGGNRFRYQIAAAYRDHLPITCSLPSAGINVCRSSAGVATACAAGEEVAINIAAIVVSHGKNGFGARNAAGNNNPAPGSADETANTNGDRKFVSRIHSDAVATTGEFDDLVGIIPATILCSRLVQAGVLP